MRKLLLLAFILSVSSFSFAQTTWYVDKDPVTPAGPGTQVAPYETIQAAIDSAADGDTVLVRPGVYKENISFGSVALTVRSDNDGDPSTNDPSKGDTIIINNDLDPSSVVTFLNGGTAEQRIEGFTLQQGAGQELYSHITRLYGGGIFSNNSSPTIVGNIVEDNHSEIGAGIFCWESTAVITGNIIRGNSTTSDTTGQGGGICCLSNSLATITNNIISGNSATLGGGIYIHTTKSPFTHIITNNTIVENAADLTLTVSVDNRGGGIVCGGSVNCIISNTILWNNSVAAPGEGPQLSLWGQDNVTVDHCDVDGGFNGVPVPQDCTLVWGDGTTDTNIDANPNFTMQAEGDYHLESDSPCIDAGRSDAPAIPDADIDGNDRGLSTGGIPDIGAYEVAANVDSDGDGLTDYEEVNTHSTDPNDPDSDGDGLNDYDEVMIYHTNPNSVDTDDDGITDDVDPTPTEAGTTQAFLVELTRDTAFDIRNLDIDLFSGNRTFIQRGRQIAMASRVYWAAWAIDRGYYSFADFMLNRVADRIDGQSPPSDWMPESMEKTELYDQILLLIDLLALL